MVPDPLLCLCPTFQKHPDFPKKPLTPYFRFFMEKRAKYAKLHPEMSNLDLTKILSKKYKELPEKKKVGGGGLRWEGGAAALGWEQLVWVGVEDRP
jgi:upstream-binding transcription factor